MNSFLGGHFDRIDLKEGDEVEKGTIIGLMGNTGHSEGAHLHYTIFDGKLTVIPYQADNLKYGGNKALTLAFYKLAGLLLDPNTKKARTAQPTYGWLSYPGHYAIDVISGQSGWPLIAWPHDKPGVVGIVRDFGSTRFGKTIVIWYGDEFIQKGIRGRIVLKEGVNIREKKDWNSKKMGFLPYESEFNILKLERDSSLMQWALTDEGWVKVEGGDFIEIL